MFLKLVWAAISESTGVTSPSQVGLVSFVMFTFASLVYFRVATDSALEVQLAYRARRSKMFIVAASMNSRVCYARWT